MADHDSIRPVARSSNGTPLFEKACPSCGRKAVVDRRKLNNRCHPCAQAARKTHGLSSHPLYRKLKNIRARCEYPRATNYAYYGGRGIKVCAEWRADPALFVKWAEANGWSPGLEVDRIDTDGDYRPDNCRIVTHRENSQRTRRIKTTPEQVRRVRQALVEGVSVKVAAKQAGVTYMVAWHISKSPDVWRNV